MTQAPSDIGGARVVCWTIIDERHVHTGNTRHYVRGELQSALAGMAIAQHKGEDAFFLFGCAADWSVVTGTWHPSLEEAQAQAAFEYEGVSETWQFAPK